jgi:hypothetical protein
MTKILWTEPALEIFLDLPPHEQQLIDQKVQLLRLFPDMYSARRTGRFRRHRYFLAGRWLVYYRRRRDTVYIRDLWPARIP